MTWSFPHNTEDGMRLTKKFLFSYFNIPKFEINSKNTKQSQNTDISTLQGWLKFNSAWTAEDFRGCYIKISPKDIYVQTSLGTKIMNNKCKS